MKNLKDYLCIYAHQRGYPKSIVESLKYHIDNTVPEALREVEGSWFIERRVLTESMDLKFNFQFRNIDVQECDRGLICSSWAPNWRQGWRRKIRNDDVQELVSHFFHFITQYIHRSNVTPFLVFLHRKYSHNCDWISSSTAIQEYSREKEEFDSNISSKYLLHTLRQLNCHNLLIHNACFHYIKAVRLFRLDYYEEAITNIECISSLCKQYARELHSPKKVEEVFSLSPYQIEIIESLYKLRCDFAAHPSRTKWWDFGELFEKEVDEYMEIGFNLIIKLSSVIASEPDYIANPVLNYDWFNKLDSSYFDAFWFNKISS